MLGTKSLQDVTGTGMKVTKLMTYAQFCFMWNSGADKINAATSLQGHWNSRHIQIHCSPPSASEWHVFFVLLFWGKLVIDPTENISELQGNYTSLYMHKCWSLSGNTVFQFCDAKKSNQYCWDSRTVMEKNIQVPKLEYTSTQLNNTNKIVC